jgi:SpoVK/Ycf46/Vps4 family AAA+-type ATPase
MIKPATWDIVATEFRGPHWPRACLLGPTGTGKTARVRQLAANLNLPVEVVLLAQLLPEDIGGLPIGADAQLRAVFHPRSQGPWDTVHTVPAWFAHAEREPVVLFFDELDKAADDPQKAATILTLLWDCELHGRRLHPQTIIICAMQPVSRTDFLASETGRALAARLAWFPIGDSREWLAAQYGLPWLTELKGGSAPEPPFIEPIPNRTLDIGLRMYDRGIDAWDALVPTRVASWLRERLAQDGVTLLRLLRRALETRGWEGLDPTVRNNISPLQAIQLLDHFAEVGPPKILEHLVARALDGEYADIANQLCDTLKRVSERCGGQLCPSHDQVEVANALRRATQRRAIQIARAAQLSPSARQQLEEQIRQEFPELLEDQQQ